MLTRRKWLLASAALQAGGALAQTAGISKEIVISSANGLQACDRALEMIRGGKDTLDAVVSGVNIVEDDPEDNSVGYGGLPNENGVVELDASVMHGPTRRAGSVASVQNIKNPSKLAKLVMEQTDHVMIVGHGALEFAKAWGFKEENLLTEKSRLAWLVWKQSLRDGESHNNWTDGLDAPEGGAKPGVPSAILHHFPHTDPEMLEWAYEVARKPLTGTINCLGLNRKGEMSGVTTTSGLAWKLAGRVGDSPIIGAGLYVDQEVGGAGSTGRGEENIRICGAHTIVENMRHGMSPKDACLDALKRVARNYNNDEKKLAQFDINFYALRKDGEFAGASLWNGVRRRGAFVSRRFAVANGGKAKLQDCIYLLERKA
ncbi:MAG: N(4)-(beta-N-acetylglucosaminyl)-L-asparaginase [Bryobacteraceae bacterium]|nr:N(4)-(beta-N-acetylglucosaminyl)-L-asparaginase [Bryobacteraceae bacterium]